MKAISIVLVLIILASIASLFAWRALDHRADRVEADRLLGLQPVDPARFSPALVANLPEPARRYFLFTIADGAALYTVAQIEMDGQFSLGSKDAPNYMEMRASQVLAAPHGFVWTMSGGSGLTGLSGSDAARWTRFWIADLLPVARFGGDPDHARAAFGRYVAEAAFWTPAALLPGPNVVWEGVGDDTARVTVRWRGLEQRVDVTVDEQGRPVRVEFQRWSNANVEGVYRLQPFGGFPSDFREVQGFQLPMHVEAGNFFGTEDYFPFFIADVTDIRFPSRDPVR